MRKIDLENNGYKLIADEGRQLMTTDTDGNEIYASEVIVPSGTSLNEWKEVVYTPKVEQPITEEELKQQRIVELEMELARLKGAE